VAENPQKHSAAVGPQLNRAGWHYPTLFLTIAALFFLFFPMDQQKARDQTSICSIGLYAVTED
jgi:hypothetical protein